MFRKESEKIQHWILVKLVYIKHVFTDFVTDNGDRRTQCCCGCRSSGTHTAHMRPDESKQVLLQLHFEFRWIVGSWFLCAVDLIQFPPCRHTENYDICTRWSFCAVRSRTSASVALAQIGQDWSNVREPLTERPVQQWNTTQREGLPYTVLTSVR